MLTNRIPCVRGILYKDSRTKQLIRRLPLGGAVALIWHRDLDQLAAEALLSRRVAAVINMQPFISGRFPTSGAALLVDAGIPLLEVQDASFWSQVSEGEEVVVDSDGLISKEGRCLARAVVLTKDQVQARLQECHRNLSLEIENFFENTLQYARKEKDLLLSSVPVPALDTPLVDRHVLVVVRGHGYRADLRAVSHYIRDFKPVLIGVDGGADALLEMGMVPDIVLGDMDSVSDEALQIAKELVVHAYPGGEAPGQERIRQLGLKATTFPVPGTSEDAALLLAYEKGARLIVAVGTHTHLVDFLEKGRSGMASTMLVRLKIGARLVDAKGVSLLYRPVPLARHLIHLITAALLVITATLLTMPLTRGLFQLTWLGLRLRLGL